MPDDPRNVQAEPAKIDVAQLLAQIYPNTPLWQHQQWANAIRREWRETAAEHVTEKRAQRIAALAEASPDLAKKIEQLPDAEVQDKYLDLVAAIFDLTSALTNLYDAAPDPHTITRIIINVEGPNVEPIILVPPPPGD